MCLASLRLVIFHEPFCKFTRKYHSSWSLEFAPRPERVERVVASPKRIPQSLEMKSFLYAAIVILQVTTSFCEMRKTIKVLKFPQIGKFGGFSKPVGHYDFEPGDQKEVTICMKFRTFAYNKGFGCPFLSDPSPIIGNACHSLTDSLTDSCLVNLIDVTLACEDANSKLVEVVTVADVDA